MKLLIHHRGRHDEGASLAGYLVMASIIIGAIAAVAGLVAQNIQHSQRRQDMVNALQFAQAGSVIACKYVATAFTNTGGFVTNLTTTAGGAFVKQSASSSSNSSGVAEAVYKRTITAPFTNQSVETKLLMADSTSPGAVKIIATAKVGKATQTAQINVEMQFGAHAAIISTARGNTSSGGSKGTAQAGNVVVDGGTKGTTKIDGGILSNGNAVTNLCTADFVSKNNYGTSGEIPDYTSPGSLYQLFDFNRFIAVADVAGTHYTNAAAFEAAAGSGAVLEGIIVVDCPKGGALPTLSSSKFPNGINVRGTLIFNFIGGWAPLDKIVNTASMKINAADLSKLVPSDPSTYTSGYPPVYSNPARNPINVNITSKGFPNFVADDDLPALMYNNAILDIHGNANICGAVYSSSFMEIENKQDGQIQYFKGALIGGGGIYVDNGKTASSIVSYDANAIGNLATAGTRGKKAVAVYRQ